MTTNNEIRRRLREGGVSIGMWMQLPCSAVGEIMGKAGYEWVAADLEHGRFSSQSLCEIFQSIELGGSLPFVRTCLSNKRDIKVALDSGARGIILPMIETPEQVQEAIANALYPPDGTRGVGYCRANLFGKEFDAYMHRANELLIVAQIEHFQAVENLEEISKIDRIDALFVGPYDLSASMNIAGQFDHPEYLKILDRIREVGRKYNKALGYHVVQPQAEMLRQKIDEGYQFIAYGVDAVFLYRAIEKPDFLR